MLTQSQVAKAQTTLGSSLISPFAGNTLYADSQGKIQVWVESAPYSAASNTGHFVKFAGPMVGTVTWTLALSAGFGSGPSEGGISLDPNEAVVIEAAHSANTGSAVVNLADPNDTYAVPANCYGFALFDSTTKHGAKGAYARASVEYKVPGMKQSSRNGSNVTFTIVYP